MFRRVIFVKFSSSSSLQESIVAVQKYDELDANRRVLVSKEVAMCEEAINRRISRCTLTRQEHFFD